MKKIKSKILLSVGAIATLVSTGSVILSCGSNQQKQDSQKQEGNKYTFSQTSGIKANIMNCIIYTKEEKYFVGTDKGLWVSIDGGSTFTQVTNGVLPNWHIFSLYQTLNGDIYIGGYIETGISDSWVSSGGFWISGGGLWVSKDGGTTFTQVVGEIQTSWYVTSIYQTSNGDIFVGTTRHGLWVSKDGGATFTQVIGGFQKYELNYAIETIYQISNGDIYMGIFDNGLWVSKDHGITFTQVSGGLRTDLFVQSIYQTTNGDIFLGTIAFNTGLWVSKDGGATFNQVSGGLRTDCLINSIYQTSNGDIFVGTGGYGLWVSKDGGITFNQVGAGIQPNWTIYSIYQPLNVDKLFVGTSNNNLLVISI